MEDRTVDASNVIFHGGNINLYGKAINIHTHGGFINIYGEVDNICSHGGFVNDFRKTSKVVTKVEKVYVDNKVNELNKSLKESLSKKNAEINTLNNIITKQNAEINEMRCTLADMSNEDESSDTEMLQKEIAMLKDKLEKARNRERVLKAKADDAERALIDYKNKRFDEYKPSKTEVSEFYRVMLGLLDCETF